MEGHAALHTRDVHGHAIVSSRLELGTIIYLLGVVVFVMIMATVGNIFLLVIVAAGFLAV